MRLSRDRQGMKQPAQVDLVIHRPWWWTGRAAGPRVCLFSPEVLPLDSKAAAGLLHSRSGEMGSASWGISGP